VLAIWLLFHIIPSPLDQCTKLMDFCGLPFARRAIFCAVAFTASARWQNLPSGNCVGEKFINFLAPLKGFDPAPQLVANVPCAGTCFIYLRPTAMPVGLAGLNINKIVLRAVLAFRWLVQN